MKSFCTFVKQRVAFVICTQSLIKNNDRDRFNQTVSLAFEFIMRKLFALALFLFTSVSFFAQSYAPLVVKIDTVSAGTNFMTGKEIAAIKHSFPYDISNIGFEEGKKLIVCNLNWGGVHSKSSGYLVGYCTETGALQFEKAIPFKKQEGGGCYSVGGMILEKEGTRSNYLNPRTGERIWSARTDFIYIDREHNVGIGYLQSHNNTSSYIEGFNLETGKLLWQRSVGSNLDIEEIVCLNETELLLSVSGLHKINVLTGKGWNRKAVTGKQAGRSYDPAIGAVVGVSFGLLGGAIYAAAAPAADKTFYGITSNTFLHDDKIYTASQKEIACLNNKGKKVWKKRLKKKESSASFLFEQNGQMYLLNRGCAFLNGDLVEYGTPYLYSFDLKNGSLNFQSGLTHRLHQIVYDYMVDDGKLYLLFKNDIVTIDLASGAEIEAHAFPIEKEGSFSCFIKDNIYNVVDGTLQRVNSDNHYAGTTQGEVFAYNKASEKFETNITEELFFYVFEWNGIRFFRHKGVLVAFDEENRKGGEIRASEKAVILGGKLYDVVENVLTEIDLRQLGI